MNNQTNFNKESKSNELGKNNIGLVVIIIILVIALGVVTFLYVDLISKTKEKAKLYDHQTSVKVDNTKKSIKIDDSKEFIYDNTTILYDDYKLHEIVININTEDAKKVQDEINNFIITGKTNNKLADSDGCKINISTVDEPVQTFYFNDYEVYESDNYISLFFENHIYIGCSDGWWNGDVVAYTFDKITGEYLTNDVLASKFDTSTESMKKLLSFAILNDEKIITDVTNPLDSFTGDSINDKINNMFEQRFGLYVNNNKLVAYTIYDSMIADGLYKIEF